MVWALFLSLFNGFQQRRFGIFPATVSQWLGHKTCWGSAFSHARPKHLFLEFGLVACRLPSLTLRKGLPCLRRLFFFVFSRFQKQRFGSFLAAVSHGLGTISFFLMGSNSDVSAFFRLRFRNGWLRFRMVWAYIYISFFLMDSNSDVSAFFRLRFRNGLGTKPAGVLPFRMRVPNTFFLSLAWWLAGFFFVFSRVQKQRFGSFLAAVSHGLGTISFFLMGSNSDVSAFFRLRFGNGLGTKPTGVLLFRMRVPNTFFLSLAWWLAGFQVLRCAKVCLA